MTAADRFIAILPDLFAVYREADKSASILGTARLPVNFYEESALQIINSYHSYIAANTINDSETTSIGLKYDNEEYSNPYQLYHDIKVVCSSLISENTPGSTVYSDIDFFYKFSTELLLRELVRVNVKIQEEPKQDRTLELESQLLNDYNRISQTYQLENGEVITHIYKGNEPSSPPVQNIYANHAHMPPPPKQMQPLFSSLLFRSHLDINPTIVPANFNVARVVPFNKNIARGDATIDTVSPAVTKAPFPVDASTAEILQDFFHPIWYTIPVPTWLSYKKPRAPPKIERRKEDNDDSSNVAETAAIESEDMDSDVYTSFAPHYDLRKSIISSSTKARVWLDHIGVSEVKRIKEEYFSNTKEKVDTVQSMDVDTPQGEDTEMKAEADLDLMEQPNDDEAETIRTDSNGKSERAGSRKINIANLVTWDPENEKVFELILEDRVDIFKSAQSLQGVISRTLLQLNKERQKRNSSSSLKVSAQPSAKEAQLYNKAHRLVVLLMDIYKVGPGDLPTRPDPIIPVLTTEYAGVLPGVPANKLGSAIAANAQSNKSLRLPSIRGPYKKRSKNLS